MKKLTISLAALLLVLLCGCAAARKAREIDAALAAAQIPVEKVEAESSQTEKAESEQAQPEQLEAEPPITFSAEDAHAAEKSEPAPVYDKAPEVCATAVFLDGAELTAYVHEEALYLRLRDYDAATGSSCAIEPWEGKKNVWLCTAILSDGTSRRISTEGQLLYDGTEGYVPLETLLFWTDGWMLPDSARESLYCSTRPRIKELPGGYRVPVLMYHAVSDDCWGVQTLFVSPSRMEEQLAYLVDNGYTPIWFEDLPNINQIEKPVILTFDDGYTDNYTELFPLLQKYNVKATVFVIAGWMGGTHTMTQEQVKELSDSGLVSIQSHTMTHPMLNTLDEETLRRELADSQLTLARVTGKVSTVLCYPTGKYSQLVQDIAKEYYDFGLLMDGWCYLTDYDRYQVGRYFVSRETDIWTYSYMAAGT